MGLHDSPHVQHQLAKGATHSPPLHHKGVGSRLPLWSLLGHVTPLLGLRVCGGGREAGLHVGCAPIRNVHTLETYSLHT